MIVNENSEIFASGSPNSLVANWEQNKYNLILRKITMKLINFLLVLFLFAQLAACNRLPTTIDVTLSDFNYTPNEITVPAGEEITLNLENDGFVSHQLVIFKLGKTPGKKYEPIDDANVYWKTEILPGKSATVKFTAPSEPGEYYVTCGLGGHHEAGMIGKLIVVER